jgi:hypothetical protein
MRFFLIQREETGNKRVICDTPNFSSPRSSIVAPTQLSLSVGREGVCLAGDVPSLNIDHHTPGLDRHLHSSSCGD